VSWIDVCGMPVIHFTRATPSNERIALISAVA